jgi:hypothetical protein
MYIRHLQTSTENICYFFTTSKHTQLFSYQIANRIIKRYYFLNPIHRNSYKFYELLIEFEISYSHISVITSST